MCTLRDTVGEMLVVHAAVLTRLSTFGVFVNKYQYAVS